MALNHRCHDSSDSTYNQTEGYTGLQKVQVVVQRQGVQGMETMAFVPPPQVYPASSISRQLEYCYSAPWLMNLHRPSAVFVDAANWRPVILNIPEEVGLQAQLLEPAVRRFRHLVWLLQPQVR